MVHGYADRARGRILEDVQDGSGFLVAQIRSGGASMLGERPKTTSQTDTPQQWRPVGKQEDHHVEIAKLFRATTEGYNP